VQQCDVNVYSFVLQHQLTLSLFLLLAVVIGNLSPAAAAAMSASATAQSTVHVRGQTKHWITSRLQRNYHCYYYYTRLTASFPRTPGKAGTREVKPVWS